MRQKNGWDDRSNVSYGLFEKRSQELIGCTSLQNISNDESQLGYWIGRSFGTGTTALRRHQLWFNSHMPGWVLTKFMLNTRTTTLHPDLY